MTRLRIISDVHGKRPQYLKLVEKANAEGMYTLQLGDLGFAYEYRRLLENENFNTDMNKFFGGNHDAYNLLCNRLGNSSLPSLSSFCLGDYGSVNLNGVSLFFVRGAFSIDKKYRSIGIDWFPEEELDSLEFDAVIDAYKAAKPELVVTHDCPDSVGHDNVLKNPDVLREFGFNPNTFSTRTQVLLQRLFTAHQPQKWVFGHYHKNWTSTVNGTEFQCLDELCYVDV